MLDTTLFSHLQFLYPFRKYQNLVLSYYEGHKEKDTKFHIVAPPGSGKTIVGLELIARIAKPAVIFSPTSTIQLQWDDKVALFLSAEKQQLRKEMVSTDPEKLALINSFTYQLLSTPGENLTFMEEAAVEQWKEELFVGGVTPTPEAALERIQLLKKNNPTKYASEIASHYRKIKMQFLKDPEFDGMKLLHPNAQKLIVELVNIGTEVIVMDESHHLLDYWALILKELIKRLPKVTLIGLTATPPIDVEEEEIENYLSILGDVDFEVPTPAVVKEGNLAPYQDLVYFTFPTEEEKRFIKTLQQEFDAFSQSLVSNERFVRWISKRFFERRYKDTRKVPWAEFFKDHVALSIAAMKYCMRVNYSIPWDIPIVDEMNGDMSIEDWVALLGDYIIHELYVSEDPVDHKEASVMEKLLKAFGFVVTEQGIRSYRSPADRILSLSDSKNTGVIEILKTEMASMGKSIRAVVITDFEKESAIVGKAFEGTLPADAGSALRTYTRVVADEITSKLNPILVTGTKILIETHIAPHVIPAMEKWRDNRELTFTITTRKTENNAIIEVTGSGKDWKTSTYVRMVTALFEEGITMCLIGTRGLLAEGWDTLGLNTLIDLTTATTSMMVQQIRGRSIRIDPNNPQKVANNWDVVCIEPHFERGDQDLRRLTKKHTRFYGLTKNGAVIKGLGHIDQELMFNLMQSGFKQVQYQLANARMIAKSRNRAAVYDAWNIGEPYQNFEFNIVKLDPKTITFKTAYTLKESIRAIITTLMVTIGLFTLQYFILFGQAIDLATQAPEIALIFGVIYTVALLWVSSSQLALYIRKAFIELPVDSYLLDIGKCMLKSLRECKFVESSLSVDNVRVTVTPERYYDIYLDYANSQDTERFSVAVHEVLSPVIDQRYLVYRTEADLKLFLFTPLWKFLRNAYGVVFEQDKMAYHPVPTIMSTRRRYADIFARNWKEYVGGAIWYIPVRKRVWHYYSKLERKRISESKNFHLSTGSSSYFFCIMNNLFET